MNQPVYFSVYPGSPEPIYSQLMGQVRRLIAGGQLKAGDRLPSVRDIASALTINPMTVSKAFGLLEAEKLIQRQPGRAMVVAEHHVGATPIDARVEMLRPTLERAARETCDLQVPATMARWLFRSALNRMSLASRPA